MDIEFQEPDLLLVEEPEIHLHPALETDMMRYLKKVSQSRQVFITTHSASFLDNAHIENIYLVTKADSTSAHLLEQQQVEEQVPMELGIRPSSLFIHDSLVFVESSTDEEILREWASKLGVNLSQSNVGFIKMGGARSFSYFAASSTLSFLANRQVKLWFLLDRDEKDDEDIAAIQDKLGDNAIARVLDKREIENYLLIPEVLRQQIAEKMVKTGTTDAPPSVERIEELLGEVADTLKEVTILKRVGKTICKPIYASVMQRSEELKDSSAEEKLTEQIESWQNKIDDLKSSITTEVETESHALGLIWNQSKLEIVPGDLLIDSLYKHFGVRFHKERGDGIELARLMAKEDISPEISKLIESIGG